MLTAGANVVEFDCTMLGNAAFAGGDEIFISIAEHHANIVPWQMVAEKLVLCFSHSLLMKTAASTRMLFKT